MKDLKWLNIQESIDLGEKKLVLMYFFQQMLTHDLKECFFSLSPKWAVKPIVDIPIHLFKVQRRATSQGPNKLMSMLLGNALRILQSFYERAFPVKSCFAHRHIHLWPIAPWLASRKARSPAQRRLLSIALTVSRSSFIFCLPFT